MPDTTRPSPATAAATGAPASTSSFPAISITLYFQNGAPAGAAPRSPSQAKTSWFSGGTTVPRSSMVTCVLIATYGCSARVTISGDDISSSSRFVDWLLQFGHPLFGVAGPVQGDLADIARGTVTVGVGPPGQRLAGGQHVVHGTVVDDGRRALHFRQVHDADVEAAVAIGPDGHGHGGVHHDGAV